MLNRIIKYFLDNRLISILLLIVVVVWGLSTAPFNWHGGLLPRDPVPVDAIPDIGENQQIVATEWMGRSKRYTGASHLSADHRFIGNTRCKDH